MHDEKPETHTQIREENEMSNLALLREERTLNINKISYQTKSSEHFIYISHKTRCSLYFFSYLPLSGLLYISVETRSRECHSFSSLRTSINNLTHRHICEQKLPGLKHQAWELNCNRNRIPIILTTKVTKPLMTYLSTSSRGIRHIP